MPSLSRRQLFRLRPGDLSRKAAKAIAREEADEPVEQSFLRPPGALEDEDDFLSSCERCHACADACPHDAIARFGPAFGRLEGTPFIDPEIQPCRWCLDMPCVNACPSGALRLDPDGAVASIAKVSIDLDRCLNSQGILCDTCSVMCPTEIRAIRIVQRKPILDLDRCTGCGMCVYHCEARPSAIAIEFEPAPAAAGASTLSPQ